MSNEDPTQSMDDAERALDAMLAQALRAPALPIMFRAQLNLALKRATTMERERQRLDDEYQQQLAELESGYLRLRYRTLGTLIGGTFAAGVAVALLMPWFNATFGANARFALAIIGAVVGVGIGTVSWLRRLGYANPLEMF